MRPLAPEAPPIFRTQSGKTYPRREASRSLSPWARASLVATPEGDALLVELPSALLAPELVLADRRARRSAHVLTLLEVGALAEGEGETSASPYRTAAASPYARHYALFPAISGCSLVRPLAAARGGRTTAPTVVLTLAMEILSGLADTHGPNALSPESIVVSTGGTAYVRGAVLEHLGKHLGMGIAARPRLAYLAPELVRSGPPRKMDERGRLFALGSMLTELATGRELLPEGPTAARLLADWSPARPDLPADAPGELRAALWALLQRDPDRRAGPGMLIALLGASYAPGLRVATALGITRDGICPYL